MARTKKQSAMPQAQIGAEIFDSLRELEKLKGIPVEYMTERLKQALTNAYRKDREDNRDIPAENVVVDLSEKGLAMHLVKTAVEEVEDTAVEIHIDAARNYNPNVQVGDSVTIPVTSQDPDPYARSCFYTGMIQLDANTAMMVYSDFRYPNKDGLGVRSILTRTIHVVPKSED